MVGCCGRGEWHQSFAYKFVNICESERDFSFFLSFFFCVHNNEDCNLNCNIYGSASHYGTGSTIPGSLAVGIISTI